MLELVGIYYAKRKFGLTWNARQVVLYKDERHVNYAFDDVEDPVFPI
jgi:hypothetical protein